METTSNRTTVLCLFHTSQQAQEALADLQKSAVPENLVRVIDGQSSSTGTSGQPLALLQNLNLPAKDLRILTDGVNSGGTVVVVSGQEQFTDKAEAIFQKHNSTKIDQKIVEDPARSAPVSGDAEGVIPVIEEELTVGKRNVERGGARVYSRIVETPVEETVTLREEHATVERRTVNRPVTASDVDALRVQSVEVTEMAEVPVVEKSARVVEEVLVGKEVSERTEHISDSVRKTEIEVESLGADATARPRTLEK